MSRFDFIAYDDISKSRQESAKAAFMHAENAINVNIEGRAKSLALTALEEAYMWVGKAIRDDQIARNHAAELQKERNNS